MVITAWIGIRKLKSGIVGQNAIMAWRSWRTAQPVWPENSTA